MRKSGALVPASPKVSEVSEIDDQHTIAEKIPGSTEIFSLRSRVIRNAVFILFVPGVAEQDGALDLIPEC